MASFAPLAGLALLCLAPSAALAQGFGGFVSPGPLAEAHADLDKILSCNQCHEAGAGVTPERCLVCHDSVQAQITDRSGFHADRDEACGGCHGDHLGREHALIDLSEETFNHQSAGFALRGEHANAECSDCHVEAPVWTGLDPTCSTCHDEVHGAAASRRSVLSSCRLCHDEDDWEPGAIPTDVFDHDKPEDSDYPLEGEHAEVACEACHAAAQFVPTAAEACTDCHEDAHGGQFRARPCTDCHTVRQAEFRIPRFDHDRTAFALRGAHADTRCTSCHGEGTSARYRPVTFERCDSCHEDVHEDQFAPRDCDACHSSDSFEGMVVDHDATDFPLRREHADVGCDDCHGEGPAATFAGLPFDDCEDCHDDVHEERFEPARCDSCHVDGTWPVDPFDHSVTRYVLDGAHVEATCASCHGERELRQLAPVAHEECSDCHADDDPHEGSLAADTCDDCHVTVDWVTVGFDHAATGFELAGGHAEPTCTECHDGQDFTDEDAACTSCHEDDRPPQHHAGDCAECHLVQNWQEATFGDAGHAVTGFALKGVHGQVACTECHASGVPAATASPECASCHATDDPHRNLLGDRCEDCHRATDWLRTSFRHALTGWPLRGAHRVASCVDCHAVSFVGAPNECRDCHVHDAPGDELHRSSFGADCEVCHGAYDWEADRFPHGD